MSFLSGLLAQPAALAVGAGALAGVVAGTAVVASGALSSPPPQQLALVACPGDERVVARVTSGQSMLVTARSGDGAWLQLYIGEPGLDKAWGPASAMRIDESIDGLPVAGCEVAVATPPVQPPPQTPTPQVTAEITLPPGVTASPPPPPTPTPLPTPTPKPTPTVKPGQTTGPTAPPAPTATPLPPPPTIPPTPTPSPTPAPDLTPPSITNVSISNAYYDGAGNYYIDNAGNACGTPSSALIRATVTDAGGSGLAGYTVTLHWIDPNGGSHTNQMSYNLTTHLYGYTITNQNAWASSTWIQYWITAADNAGNTAQTSNPPTNQLWLFKGLCIL